MTDKTLYKYQREDGGYDVSPEEPDTEYTTLHRLIADEGMALYNEEVDEYAFCIDVDEVTGWVEIIAPPEEEE